MQMLRTLVLCALAASAAAHSRSTFDPAEFKLLSRAEKSALVTFTAALPVSGSVTLPAHGLTATAGRSLVIPACLGEVLLDLAPHTALYVLRESDPA